MDGREVADVVAERVAAAQRGLAVASDVPGEARARAEVVLVGAVELVEAGA